MVKTINFKLFNLCRDLKGLNNLESLKQVNEAV